MADARRDFTLVYEGVDISDDVDVISCVLYDKSGEADLLDLKLDHADRWFAWKPQKNDRLRVSRSGFDSKDYFLSAVSPEDGAYRIIASSQRSVYAPRRWQSYEDKTLYAILNLCAAEKNMKSALYGLNGGLRYDYILRENESAPEFMRRLCALEGACLKAVGGEYKAISIEYAQSLAPMHMVELDAKLLNARYTREESPRLGSVKIETPYGCGLARDPAFSGPERVISGLCVQDDAQAWRWAKGILLQHNRKCELLELEMDFNPGYSALVRIDVNRGTDAAGGWLIEEVRHDLFRGRTRAKLLRCLAGIG